MILNKKKLSLAQKIVKRQKKDTFFKWLGWGAIYFVLLLFFVFLMGICMKSVPIFFKQEVKLAVALPKNTHLPLSSGKAQAIVENSFRTNKKTIIFKEVVSLNAWKAFSKEMKKNTGRSVGQQYNVWVPVKYKATQDYKKRKKTQATLWLAQMKKEGSLRTVFNWSFFSNADSLSPETAGIKAALVGTLFVLLIAFLAAFPVGILVAIYLECFLKKETKISYFISANINNLAAVPSIIFGLLGIAVFLNFFLLPRSSSLVGGLTLGLMMLPVIIVSSRMSLRQVPENLQEAAMGLGASKTQAVFHQVVPVAMPGIITGVLLSFARIIGETAPLLMVGMVVFLVQAPTTLDSPATVFPVQIYQWFQRPEEGFIEASSGAIVILLLILFLINSLAFFVRKRFEKFNT